MTIDPLLPEHREALEQDSSITPQVIAAWGYRTVTTKKVLAALGFSPVQQRTPELRIPLYAPAWDRKFHGSRSIHGSER